jgi:hypothetical protein
MLRLDKVIKPWKESAALNDHINLYGFWNETAFLTKSSDVGMVLSIPGVDYESLDRSEQEYAVKRLEAALKAFGPGFHVYQYLFKSNCPDIPFARYDDPVVEAAIASRGSSLKRNGNISIRLKSSTACSSKAPGRRPAWARRSLAFSMIPLARLTN